MKDGFQQASDGAVVRRALWCMAIVGAVLITINHGDALVAGEVSGKRLIQIGLTLLVPYCVSTVSSVGAMRAFRRQAESPSGPINND